MAKSERLVLGAIFIMLIIVVLLCVGIYQNTLPREDSALITIEVEEGNWYHLSITEAKASGNRSLYDPTLTLEYDVVIRGREE